MYIQIIGSLPTEKYSSPNQIIIPDSLQSILGKTVSFKSNGESFFNEDRIFIREALKNIYKTIGCLAIDIFIKLPCGILQTNCEICLISSHLINQQETQKRIIQVMNFSECVIVPVHNEKYELSSSILSVFTFSKFLYIFASQPGKVDLCIINIKTSQTPLQQQQQQHQMIDLSKANDKKQLIIGQLQNIIRKKIRLTSSMGSAFLRIQFQSLYPEYYHSQLHLMTGTTKGRLLSNIPLLAWLLLTWPLSIRGNRLKSNLQWQQLKEQIWFQPIIELQKNPLHFDHNDTIMEIYYKNFLQLFQTALQVEESQKPILSTYDVSNDKVYIRNVNEYDELLRQRFPMVQESSELLIQTQYSNLLSKAIPLLPSLADNSITTNNYHTINSNQHQQIIKIPYQKPFLNLLSSNNKLFTEYEEKTGKQLFHPLGNWNQHTSESKRFLNVLIQQYQFQVTSVQQGPDSQFRAFAHQVYGDENAWSLVKLLVLNDILQNATTLYQHMLDASLIHLYIRKLNNSTISGDHVTLCALANVYQNDILIYSPLFPLPIRIRPSKNKLQSSGIISTPLHSSSSGSSSLNHENSNKFYALGYFNARDYKSLFKSSLQSNHETSSSIIIPGGINSNLTLNTTTAIEHTIKYRKLNLFHGFYREIPSLNELAMDKIIEYSHLLPELQGALPEELIQQLITKLIVKGKFTDVILYKLLDESIENLDLSRSNAVRNSTLEIITKLSPRLKTISLQSCLNISSDGVIILARFCGNSLSSINLSGCISLTDKAIEEISKFCNSLVHIDLTGCIHITPKAISKLSSCPLLESLSLKNCKQITDPVIESLGNQLQQLDLTDCDQITDLGIVSIISKSGPNVKSLKISGRKITDLCLNQVAGSCHHLEHLELHDCEYVSDESVKNITQSCTQLSSLKLPNCKNLTPAAFLNNNSTHQSSLQNLICLDLSDCTNVTDIALDYILKSCPSLQIINLSSCEEITDAGLIRLVNSCIHLIDLNLTRCKKLTDLSICTIAQKLPKIQNLKLCNCIQITDQSIIELTKYCRFINELDISFCDFISGDSIKQIPVGFPNLKVLKMEELSKVDDNSLLSLSGCSNLNALFIGYCNISDSVLFSIADSCSEIHTLDISRCTLLTLDGIQKAISCLFKLRSIYLCRSNLSKHAFRHNMLEFIDFSWCSKLEDSAIMDICNFCPRIQNLELAWCSNLTDSSLDSIARLCSQLYRINLRGCSKFTSAAVSRLTSTGRVVLR